MRWFLFAVLPAFGFFGLRAALVPEGLDSWDAVDFVLALKDYDLELQQPHFPGYPLYILAAKAFAPLAQTADMALRLVGIAAGALIPLLLARLVPESQAGGGGQPKPASIAGALILAGACQAPGIFLGSIRIESDLATLAVLLLACLLAARRRAFLSGLTAGLALGFRAGALPLALGVLLGLAAQIPPPRLRHLGRWGVGWVLGMLLWWGPQLALCGPEYFQQARFFIRGHFLDWGGAWTAESDIGSRLAIVLERFLHGCGIKASNTFTWGLPMVIFFAVGLAAGLRHRKNIPGSHWLLCLMVPQFITVILFQNPERMRHHYPLILGAAALAGLGWRRLEPRWRWAGVLLCLWMLGVSVHLALERRSAPPPRLQAIRTILERGNADEEWVFCGESARLFEVEDAERRWTVKRARNLQGVMRELNSSLSLPRRILIFSEILDREASTPQAAPILSLAGDPLLDDLPHLEVFVYEIFVTPGTSAAVGIAPRSEFEEPRRPAEGIRSDGDQG